MTNNNGLYASGARSQQPTSLRGAPSSRGPRSVATWATPGRDPLDRVLDMGSKKSFRILVGATLVTLAFHGAAAARTAYIHSEMIAWTLKLDSAINHKLAQQIDIEAEKTPARQPEKMIEPPEEKVAAKQDTSVAAAKAAQILARDPSNDVLDFSDNVFNVGTNERYSGGATRSDGTNDKAVTAPKVEATGNPQPVAPQVVAVDLSRTATLAGSGEWRCPFPPEADADQVDDASAIIEVIVGDSGKAQRATILQDPGHGFGREARACAMREAYVPALDREGKAVASSKKFRVKFER